jgi:hypothetical protein
VSRLKFQPGQVAHYFWPSLGGRTLGELFAVIVVLVALLLTVRSWGRAARSHGAAASARLLNWLLVPLVAFAALGLYAQLVHPNWPDRPLIALPSFAAILAVLMAWSAAIMAAVLTAGRRALSGEDPWSPSALAWGALRHFRPLFLLLLWFALPSVVQPALRLTLRDVPNWAATAPLLLSYWAMVALLLAPAIIVSETAGALDGVRLALRAWLRAPLHLVLAIVLGVAALWLASLLEWLIVQAVAGPVAVGIALKVAGLAARALVTVWAAVVALLLWQRLRDRVMPESGAAT